MKNEIRIFFTAMMFYTRIPCPRWVGHEPEYINLSVRYFPLIGWIIGAGAFLAYASSAFLFESLIGVIFSLIVSVFLTGAFHEDGFADVCDGFGGGWTREQILTIMKDSRLGTYGTVGLLLLFALKITALFSLSSLLSLPAFFWLFITSHALSRMSASLFIFTQSYVQDTNQSKAKPVAKQTGLTNLFIALPCALIPLGLLVYTTGQALVLSLIPALALAYLYLAHTYKKRLGGYTGDCLGAAQQIFEIVILLSVLGVWKFI